ncbi:MAG: hydrogenase formation protein HypD [gamma proteobacterium symbiont of Lucinoma myriamae]|nr:hydrogenase formation protein HypD [gamma proteobacterium symbiont of Lucinoma myriamae]
MTEQLNARAWLLKVNELMDSAAAQKKLASKSIKIMNVCGGHERSISMAGIRNTLHPQIELIPGPGCPVCICPEEDIYQAIQLALHEDIILVAFGDMLRVPVNVAKKSIRTLQDARASGADIRPIASPLEARQIALDNPQKQVVFFAAGFETTTAPTAGLIAEGIPDNLLFLLSGRLTWPAVSMLLESGSPGFDALVAPGHVATIMGADEWQFVISQHHLPTAVAGFTTESLLAAFYSVIRQKLDDRLFLDNCYPQLVTNEGNLSAQKQLTKTMDIVDANWRGIGIIPGSGFELKTIYKQHNARIIFPDYAKKARRHIGEMPAGCDCASVVLGKKYPNQCKLYGTVCTPKEPIGPRMVSDEGACQIWWTHGMRDRS